MRVFIKGDITKLSFDVIVKSANKSLLRGGGVDGAILEQECIEPNECYLNHLKKL